MLYDVNASRTLRLVVKSDYAGVTCINSFYYVTDTAPDADQIAAFWFSFTENVINKAKDLQVSSYAWRNATITALDGSVYSELALPAAGVAGAATGDGMPPFVTLTYRFRRSIAGVRGGYKRFSGISEAYHAGGIVLTTGGADVVLSGLAAALVAPITAIGNTFVPVVVASTYNGQKLPALKYWRPVGADWNTRFGSQNTRKK